MIFTQKQWFHNNKQHTCFLWSSTALSSSTNSWPFRWRVRAHTEHTALEHVTQNSSSFLSAWRSHFSLVWTNFSGDLAASDRETRVWSLHFFSLRCWLLQSLHRYSAHSTHRLVALPPPVQNSQVTFSWLWTDRFKSIRATRVVSMGKLVSAAISSRHLGHLSLPSFTRFCMHLPQKLWKHGRTLGGRVLASNSSWQISQLRRSSDSIARTSAPLVAMVTASGRQEI